MPKPLVRVNGMPLLERAVGEVWAAGITEVVCIINNEAAAEVEEYCRQRDFKGSLTLVRKTTPNSMESLFTLAPYLTEGPFLLLTVDTIFPPASLAGLLGRRDELRRVEGIIAVTPFIDDEKPLHVAMDGGKRITEFGQEASPYVAAGLYLLSPRIFREIAAARRCGILALRGFLEFLLARGYWLCGHIIPKAVDVDRPEDIAAAEAFLQEEGISSPS